MNNDNEMTTVEQNLNEHNHCNSTTGNTTDTTLNIESSQSKPRVEQYDEVVNQFEEQDQYNNNNNHNEEHEQQPYSIIRIAMTILLLLIICSAILSIIVISKYKFIISLLWTLLLSFFIGFCYFLYETVFNINNSKNRRQQRRHVFHPIVYTMKNYVVSGISNFINDCYIEYTNSIQLISNEPAFDQYYNIQHVQTTTRASTTTNTTKRTKLFRIFVQPIMRNILFRKKYRNQNNNNSNNNNNNNTKHHHQQHQQQQQQQEAEEDQHTTMI